MIGSARQFRARLLEWYGVHQRDLPWRAAEGEMPRAYHVMVSEFMLQQTQVKMALPFFLRFMEKFPTVAALAEAEEQEVLRMWQGLGYYSRARNLRLAAREIRDRFGGKVPASVEELRLLPGVGRYTAGAIASMAYNARAPIVDGNVARVICRLDLIQEDARSIRILNVLWKRAEEMVPAEWPGDFNSALMELGATVCTPRRPRCLECPVRKHCAAAAAGLQEEIPAARPRQPVPRVKRVVFGLEKDGKWLIEQRPSAGRWGSLWQFPTFAVLPQKVDRNTLKQIGTVQHTLTHRKYLFTAYRCRGEIGISKNKPRKWVAACRLADYPMSKPQREIGKLLGLFSE